MTYPKIALIGRPNVGKSSLFNRLLKKRTSIVNEEEGVTRDRIYGELEFNNSRFILIDTAGLSKSKELIHKEMVEQSKRAIEEADYCLLVVDSQIGLTKADEDVARLIKQKKKPMSLVINKVDNEAQEICLHDFHTLGISNTFMVSCAHGNGFYDLLEHVASDLKDFQYVEELEDRGPRITIVGRTNVGKSTLVNALTEENRCVVSPEAATTRDTIEVEIEREDLSYLFIDTAGIRRKQKETSAVEKFASIRTFEAIEKSNICLLMISSDEGMRSQEKKLLSEIYKSGKACIILLNKWDKVKNMRMEHVRAALIEECPFVEHYPILFISALMKKNLDKLYPLINKVYQLQRTKKETSAVNRFFELTLRKQHPPLVKGKRLRIYYATQLKSAPPTFMLFINHTPCLTYNYQRFLINQMREHFQYYGMPIRFILKNKMKKGVEASSHH